MDIREAIQHCQEVAAGGGKQGKCPECAEDHRQLASWLEKLEKYQDAQKSGQLLELPLDKVRWLNAILAERNRQDKKWGFPQENTYCEWASILAEETGELCQELNELNFGRGDRKKMETEAVQVAAVALSILEQADVAHKITTLITTALDRPPIPQVETKG